MNPAYKLSEIFLRDILSEPELEDYKQTESSLLAQAIEKFFSEHPKKKVRNAAICQLRARISTLPVSI